MTDIFDRSLDDIKVEISDNKIEKGEEVNLTSKDPTMKNVIVAVGWQLNSFDADALDIDVSCFLLISNISYLVFKDKSTICCLINI